MVQPLQTRNHGNFDNNGKVDTAEWNDYISGKLHHFWDSNNWLWLIWYDSNTWTNTSLLRNYCKWNFIQNATVVIQEHAFRNIAHEMAADLSRSQCIKSHYFV